MREYQAYILRPDGHIQYRVDLSCHDEAQARDSARVGAFSMATSKSDGSASARASRRMPSSGAGTAGSFRSRSAVSAPMVLRRPSRRHATRSKPHGLTSCPAAAIPTSTNTASSARTSRGNTRCGTPAAGCRRRLRLIAADVSAVSRSPQRASAITSARATWTRDDLPALRRRRLGVRNPSPPLCRIGHRSAPIQQSFS